VRSNVRSHSSVLCVRMHAERASTGRTRATTAPVGLAPRGDARPSIPRAYATDPVRQYRVRGPSGAHRHGFGFVVVVAGLVVVASDLVVVGGFVVAGAWVCRSAAVPPWRT
jgi:hypothetical protein